MRRRSFVRGLTVTTAATGLGLTAAGNGSAAAPAPAAVPTAGSAGAAVPGGAVRARGAGWREVPVPAGEPAALLSAVAAAGPDLAWAVGEEARDGSISGRPLARTWDGSAWRATDVSHLAFAGSIRSVAATPLGTGDADGAVAAWAVGYDRAGGDHLLAWDGSTWREHDFPGVGQSGVELWAVAVAPDGTLRITGTRGDGSRVLRSENAAGTRWSWSPALPTADDSAPSLWNVHVDGAGDTWVSGGLVVARYDDRSWDVLPGLFGLRLSVTDLLPTAPDDIWLTGHDYGAGGPPGKPPSVVLRHYDGAAWTDVEAPFTVGSLGAIAADAAGRPALIAGWDFWDGTSAHYLRWDGERWRSERGPAAAEGVTPLMSALAPIPGTAGFWSAGTTATAPFPPAQARIERYDA
ncbi:hypothetical protein [Streptomyces sp. MAR4 CNX-425]|uniref:hypothetical protein n=1 Tax=Streptomyces sp. MAR4 CNX-425 TaxID=3406343 RepID=UPI003B500111